MINTVHVLEKETVKMEEDNTFKKFSKIFI